MKKSRNLYRNATLDDDFISLIRKRDVGQLILKLIKHFKTSSITFKIDNVINLILFEAVNFTTSRNF